MISSSIPIRATKVVVTLGPGSDSHIEALVACGADVFRLNFSHGSHAEHRARVRAIREASEAANRFVGILGDLQGPKIRIGQFEKGVTSLLSEGDQFVIDGQLATASSHANKVGCSHANLASQLRPGQILVLGDGEIELEVADVDTQRIHCKVLVGGELHGGKGINLRGGGLSLSALTNKDVKDLEFACQLGLDYVAVSFVRNAADVIHARDLVEQFKGSCGIVAKVERAEAVRDDTTLDAIIKSADAVMVARGDLGIEIGDAALMGVQKRLIARARQLNRSVITATQMMESMVTNPKPTRAEVMDVANAVVDGTDAVMLSAETAVGAYPVQTVSQMINIIKGAEASLPADSSKVSQNCHSIDESIAKAAMFVSGNLDHVKAVACLTASGNTPKLMAQARSSLPIYALADSAATLARMALIRGVHPRMFRSANVDYDKVNDAVLAQLKNDGVVERGDLVVISKGDYRNVQGGTNTLKILEVE